jgi:two-component system, NtrC family, response regulator HydG
MPQALIIDDDLTYLQGLADLVEREGFTTLTARSIQDARAHLASTTPDIVLTDLVLPDGEGIELLKDLEQQSSRTAVVLISGQATVDSAIEALRKGAIDYLTKPIDVPRLKTVLANIARTRELQDQIGNLKKELRQRGVFERLIGNSPAMQKVYDLILKVAPTDATVLLTGESGTGKELVAQTVHEQSRRRREPFLPLNCGAVPPNLIESELFGHERGSFTGATQLHRGYFERVSGGSLFLDEITEMPMELQVKLLRVLETGTVLRVGGDEALAVDVRVIAATNRSPEGAVADGKLREDLLYRLNVFPVHLPPLREREDDIALLADHFLTLLNQSEGTGKRFSASARQRIRTYSWPGNVRELKNAVQRSFILAESQVDLDVPSENPLPAIAAEAGPQSVAVGASLAEVERKLILATLEHYGGDKKKTAEVLGISLKTLYNRLNLYFTTTSSGVTTS